MAALCHDIGKAVSVPNHPEIAAGHPQALRAPRGPRHDPGPPGLPGPALLRPLRRRPDAREQHRAELDPEVFTLAERFADEWDQVAFDPDYDSEPLEHFEPLVREVFAQAKML